MSEQKKRVLVYLAHPSLHKSEINSRLFNIAQGYEFVTCVDLYAEYPRFNISADKEQQRLLDHDVIIFLFPLFWYAAPAIVQEWKELVLEYGFAYGINAKQLTGKTILCAVSAGAKEEDYHTSGRNHLSVRQFLSPFEGMANLTAMRYLPPFVLFATRSAQLDSRLVMHETQWRELLQALYEDRVDYSAVKDLDKINQDMNSAIRGGKE